MEIAPFWPGLGDPRHARGMRDPHDAPGRPPPALRETARGRPRPSSSSGSDSDGEPASKQARTESAAPARTTPAAPDPASDAYATHVLATAARHPLSDAQLASFREGVTQAVRRSQGWLVDRQTADAIRATVLAALDGSPTFRAAVSYGMHQQQEDLDDITYRNRYGINLESYDPTAPLDIGALSVDALRRSTDATVPIVPANEAARDGDRADGSPYVSVGAAPDADSPYLASWRALLIHELIHHVSGAHDPAGSAEHRQGPTEILARRVADEMHWSIPASNGYGDPARIAHIYALNRAALIDAAARHADHQRAFFGRLQTLGAEQPASHDFHEFGGASSASNDTLTGDDDPFDLDRIELHPSLAGLFADSAPAGAPTGFASAWDASSAGWQTQGRFFRHGAPVDGNPHRRAFGFADGSRVVVSAHEPLLTDSDGLKCGRFMTVAASATVGGLAGFVVGGPPGAAAGAVAAAVPAATLAHAYEFDRIWQGYTLDYYEKGADQPFFTQYMYAWDNDPKRVERMSKLRDPREWADYADHLPDRHWDWWTWRSGNAPLRS